MNFYRLTASETGPGGLRMKNSPFIVSLIFLLISAGIRINAQSAEPIINPANLVTVAPNIYVIPDNFVPLVPNVGVVVGENATLVIDTGLGPRNGEIILAEVERLSDNELIYVVTTHYHPEHSLGMAGLGDRARLVIPSVQQDEMAGGEGIKNAFASRSEVTARLLEDVQYPQADILFDGEIVLNLGGLTARLIQPGVLHTRGDTLVLIEEERVLFSGDVLMKGLFPSPDGDRGSIQRWLDVLAEMEAMAPVAIIGAHGDIGDSTMITDWRELFLTLREDIRQLKEEGIPQGDAAEILNAEYTNSHPHWRSEPRRMNAAVRVGYRELP